MAERVSADELRGLAERAFGSGQQPLAGLLYTLAGFEVLDMSRELAIYVMPIAAEAIRQAEAVRAEVEAAKGVDRG